jgi:hypothetical protein
MNDIAEPTVAAAAQVAKDVRSEADAVLEEVDAAIESVNEAVESANRAASDATSAATRAETEANKAERNLAQINSYMSGTVNPAVEQARNAAAEATEAAENVEQAISSATTAAGRAETAATSAEAAATNANTATEGANAAASVATEAAAGVDKKIESSLAEVSGKLEEIETSIAKNTAQIGQISGDVGEASGKLAELDATKLDGEKVGTTEPTEDFEISAEIEAKLAELSEDVNGITERVESIKPIVIYGDVTNAPDEEDITSESNLLKLKDRPASNGMGYVILRKNKTFAEQVTKENTIYEIRYDFDLGGQEINIPKNCVLQFEGGSLSNGSIVGEQTEIAGVLYHILNNVTLKGRFSNLASNLVWWGAASGEGIDNSAAIQCALDSNIYIVEVSDDYYISSPISLPYNKVIHGRSGYNNKLTGFYANNDFSPKVVDFSSRNGKDAFSQEVRGMFYHRDTTQLELRDIFIDARHKADYCIELVNYEESILHEQKNLLSLLKVLSSLEIRLYLLHQFLLMHLMDSLIRNRHLELLLLQHLLHLFQQFYH